MPGISIVKGNIARDASIGNAEADSHTKLLEALKSVLHNESYSQKILLRYGSILLAYTTYPEYPMTVYEDDQFWVCIEGKIYGQNDYEMKKGINSLLNQLFVHSTSDTTNEIDASWLSTTDGEFIIYALNKNSKEFVIFNDILGRLPLYYYEDDSIVVISRELSLITNLARYRDDGMNYQEEYLFDRLAIAEYLLFGYTLDRSMLQKGIYQMQPGSLIRLGNTEYSQACHEALDKRSLRIETLYSFNFDQKKYAKESLRQNTNKVSYLFSEACKVRLAKNGYNIISLSGGFDSRIVASCFYKNRFPCVSVTYIEPNWKPILGRRTEAEIASEVSSTFGLSWENYRQVQTRAKDLISLLNLKGGTNYLGFGFMLPFLESLVKKYSSSSVLFTGDGGCRIFVNLDPPRKLRSMDDLVNYVLDRMTFISMSDVCNMVNISEKEIIDEIRRILSSYPEEDMNKKFVHFIFYGSAFKHLFEAEDRNRIYLWSTSPYYSIPLVNYVMNCSDDNKLSRALHREILLDFSPSAARVDNSDYGCSIFSLRFRVIVPLLKTITLRYPTLRRIVRQMISNKGGASFDNRMIKCLFSQIKIHNYLRRYFSTEKLTTMIKSPSRHGFHAIHYLFTIISLIELAHSDKSSIEKYYD